MKQTELQMNCPACFTPAQSERIVGTQAYCNCGLAWSINGKSHKSEEFQSKSNARSLIIFFLSLMVAVSHYIAWDTYSFEILPLKAKQLLGLADKSELKSIVQICEQRKRKSCQIDALLSLYKIDKSEVSVLLSLGELYMQNRNFYEATHVYKLYFQDGRQNNLARETYAKALMATGDLKSAQEQYRLILSNKTAAPNYLAARAYVEILMQSKNYKSAKQVIETYRKAGPTSAMFLDKEWKTLNNLSNKPMLSQYRLPANQQLEKKQTR